ncbi:MAG: GNAT family protein [Pseudomonadota bacterium]
MTAPAAEPWPPTVSLTGTHARLVPLGHEHRNDIADFIAEGALHLLWYTNIPTAEDVGAEIDRRLALRQAGEMLPFAVLDRDGRAIGMTTYLNIDAVNQRLEIGSTFYDRKVQRSPVNTECKLMLLTHAFETLGVIAVEFRTHFVNIQSRRAIERLGAKLDGVLRSHTRSANGTLRDTAVYSITAAEWPTIRTHLTFQLTRPR